MRVGADKAHATSAETTHILESILKVEGEKEYYRILGEGVRFEARKGNNEQKQRIRCTRYIDEMKADFDKRTDNEMAAYLGFEKRLIRKGVCRQFQISNPGTGSRLPSKLNREGWVKGRTENIMAAERSPLRYGVTRESKNGCASVRVLSQDMSG